MFGGQLLMTMAFVASPVSFSLLGFASVCSLNGQSLETAFITKGKSIEEIIVEKSRTN